MRIIARVVMLLLFGVPTVLVNTAHENTWSIRQAELPNPEIVVNGHVIKMHPLQGVPFRIQIGTEVGSDAYAGMVWVGRSQDVSVSLVTQDSSHTIVVVNGTEVLLSGTVTGYHGVLKASTSTHSVLRSEQGCATNEVDDDNRQQWIGMASAQNKYDHTQSARYTVRVSVDVDWQGRQQFSTVDETIAYCTTILSSIRAMYDESVNVDVQLANLRVWDVPNDPFPDDDALTNASVQAFKANIARVFHTELAGTPGDVHALWTNRDNLSVGGVAGQIGGILHDTLNSFIAQIRMGSTFNAKIAAHELGHVLGSAHTHSCLWPTGPIDSCWAPEDGTCFEAARPSQGTIMSYCDLPSVGGTLLPTFHPLTASIIRGYLSVAQRLGNTESNAVGSAEVHGLVLFDGKPLVGLNLELAEVSAYSIPSTRRRTTYTNSDGRYRFENVPAGYYGVFVADTTWFWEENLKFSTVRIVTEGKVQVDIEMSARNATLKIVDSAPLAQSVNVIMVGDYFQALASPMVDGVWQQSFLVGPRYINRMRIAPFDPEIAWNPSLIDFVFTDSSSYESSVISTPTPQARTLVVRLQERGLDFGETQPMPATNLDVRVSDFTTSDYIRSIESGGKSVVAVAGMPYGDYRFEPIVDNVRYVEDRKINYRISATSTPMIELSHRRRSEPFVDNIQYIVEHGALYEPIAPTFIFARGDSIDD